MNWDKYFYNLCDIVASKSPCLSRKIGTILVKDNRVVATGYNGPPVGIPHCGQERLKMDENLKLIFGDEFNDLAQYNCPRQVLGYKTGEGLNLCLAQHAEENCISTAALLGVSTKDCTLYINTVIPCQRCFGKLINAGIKEIVCKDRIFYDDYSEFLYNFSNICIRTFEF
jgi:dCMP deaminase